MTAYATISLCCVIVKTDISYLFFRSNLPNSHLSFEEVKNRTPVVVVVERQRSANRRLIQEAFIPLPTVSTNGASYLFLLLLF